MVSERSSPPRVALVTLGCARNDVDSEELAGRLAAEGWEVAGDGDEGADVVVVNTCTFVEQAKKDSVDAVLAAGADGARVVAVGCMAERYGAELAEALPEASAVLGFDHYGDLPARLDDVGPRDDINAGGLRMPRVLVGSHIRGTQRWLQCRDGALVLLPEARRGQSIPPPV